MPDEITKPMPFAEAYSHARLRGLLPTDLGSQDIQVLIPRDVRTVSVFSAKVAEARVLQHVKDTADRLLRGRYEKPGDYQDVGTFRIELNKILDETGYEAEPAKEGSIEDLRSLARQNLIIETQMGLAEGFGRYKQDTSTGQLLLRPAWELLRKKRVRAPRGTRMSKDGLKIETRTFWLDKWKALGGPTFAGTVDNEPFTYGERMVALKSDPIWERISRFGVPYPPFDYNSGFGVETVTRVECIRIGLIEKQDRTPPAYKPYDPPRFVDNVEASTNSFSPSILDALKAVLKGIAYIQGDALKLFKH